MYELPATLIGLLAGLVTWIFTSVGAGSVFLKREFSRKTLDVSLGLAAGVMLAASVWSLLLPAMEIAQASWGVWRIIPASAGLLAGALLIRLLDLVLPHIHALSGIHDGPGSRLPKNMLLILAITLHNVPEALAVGVSFGAAVIDPEMGWAPAITLMLAIGLQNLPEGMAVSMPLLREGMSRKKAFYYGQLSGLVEPFTAALGAALASIALPFLPWALSIAAGAMLFVTVEEVIPESQASGNHDAATLGVMTGFALMMCLDIVFG